MSIRRSPPMTVNSVIDGIAWPGLPAVNGAALLAVLFQLEQTQWWTPDVLLRHQRKQLQQLIAHARAHVPFYRERLRGFPDLPADASWLSAWRDVPILRREEIQASDPDDNMIAEYLPEGHGELREIYTSGSTGKPIRSVRTQLWELIWSAFTIRDHLWHRRDFTTKFAGIRESGKGKALYPEGSVAQGWGYSSTTIFSTGPMVSLNVATPLEQQAEWLQRNDPAYLITHPSLALRLADYCREANIDVPNLREVITIAENLRPEVRAACRAAWDVPLTDIYSTREVGYVALQCPQHDHYHVQSEGVFVEVLDDNGKPCGAGESGRVLVTPLHNLGMPLIRYDIGDVVELGEPCPCGRGLPVMRRIIGRRQNMLVLPSGERKWPLLSSDSIETMLEIAPAIRQYQFVQKDLDLIELRLVVSRPLNEAEEGALLNWVREKFAYAYRLALAYVGEMPRTEAGKFEDFVSEIRHKD